jgi:hypothetical protein
MQKNHTHMLTFGSTRLSTSPCMIGGASTANAISANCSAVGAIGLPRAVATIVLKTGINAETSTQASQIVKVTCRRRSEDTGSVVFIAMGVTRASIAQTSPGGQQLKSCDNVYSRLLKFLRSSRLRSPDNFRIFCAVRPRLAKTRVLIAPRHASAFVA